MVLEEGGPSLRLGLGRIWPDANQVSGHGALTDDVAELHQLSVDPRSTPSWILLRHLADEAADLGAGRRATAPRLPAPEEAERAAVPGDHGLRPDQDQAVFPAAPATQGQGPEGSVPAREGQSGVSRPFEDTELVPEGQDFSREGRASANQGDQEAKEEPDQGEHPE